MENEELQKELKQMQEHLIGLNKKIMELNDKIDALPKTIKDEFRIINSGLRIELSTMMKKILESTKGNK